MADGFKLEAFVATARKVKERVAVLCDRIERHDAACAECAAAWGWGKPRDRCDVGDELARDLTTMGEAYVAAIDELIAIDFKRYHACLGADVKEDED